MVVDFTSPPGSIPEIVMPSCRFVSILILFGALFDSGFERHELCAAEEPRERPALRDLRVERVGEAARIAFSATISTDVEVAVLDAKDRVVRHLAAGVVGDGVESPPPLKPGLAQRLDWDGRDDAGRPAQGGPFRVRVRAGMQCRFGRIIGGRPDVGSVAQMPYRAPVNGLVTDAQGNLYVKLMSSVGSHGNSGRWPWHVRKFDRNGKYVSTILPYSASTPPEKASGMTLLDAGNGRFTPANQNSLYPVFYQFGNEILPRLQDGKVVFSSSEEFRLTFFALDGSNALSTVAMWPEKSRPKMPRWLDIQVALSPDGRTAYYSNLAGTPYDGRKPDDVDPAWPQGRVYRHDLSRADALPTPFFDLELPDFEKAPYWMPSAWDKKTAASGIDVDAAGNVHVGDLVNHQLVEIDPSGRKVGATPVPWPDKVLVSRRGDTRYVVSRKVSRGHLPAATLVKLAGRGADAKVVAELKLEGTVGGSATLDESGDVPVLWLAGDIDDRQTRLIRVEDRGGELAVTGSDFLNSDPDAIGFVGYMDVDREKELVYVTGSGRSVWRYDGRTGKGGLLPIKAVDVAIGPAGMIYAWGTGSYYGPIARYTRDLDPAPLSPDGPHTYGSLYGRAGRGTSVCGLDVDLAGRVFATWGSNDCHIRAYDAEGKLIDSPRKILPADNQKEGEVPAIVSGVVGYGGSLRLDAAGNIYVLQHGLPADFVPPRGWESDEAFRVAVGTVYKFGPQGGSFVQGPGNVKEATGSLATYPACGPVSRWRSDGSCACTKPRFDVDEYGRLYLPNGITFNVSVRDNANREIVGFGSYGNFDDQGPGGAKASPEIPLGWPIGAAATDEHIYVGDCLNHRIVRVDKTFDASAIAAVP